MLGSSLLRCPHPGVGGRLSPETDSTSPGEACGGDPRAPRSRLAFLVGAVRPRRGRCPGSPPACVAPGSARPRRARHLSHAPARSPSLARRDHRLSQPPGREASPTRPRGRPELPGHGEGPRRGPGSDACPGSEGDAEAPLRRPRPPQLAPLSPGSQHRGSARAERVDSSPEGPSQPPAPRGLSFAETQPPPLRARPSAGPRAPLCGGGAGRPGAPAGPETATPPGPSLWQLGLNWSIPRNIRYKVKD